MALIEKEWNGNINKPLNFHSIKSVKA